MGTLNRIFEKSFVVICILIVLLLIIWAGFSIGVSIGNDILSFKTKEETRLKTKEETRLKTELDNAVKWTVKVSGYIYLCTRMWDGLHGLVNNNNLDINQFKKFDKGVYDEMYKKYKKPDLYSLLMI